MLGFLEVGCYGIMYSIYFLGFLGVGCYGIIVFIYLGWKDMFYGILFERNFKILVCMYKGVCICEC